MKAMWEQLAAALREELLNDALFIVRLLRLTNENYPGRDAAGVLPLVVVGHQDIPEGEWARWVMEHGTPCYGTAYAKRLVETGVDIKEMMPTAPFGREIRRSKIDPVKSFDNRFWFLNQATSVLAMVEKWPPLYNLMAEEMAEEDMTLETFINRVMNMPSPWEIGQGRYLTLGDLMKRTVSLVPGY